MTATEKSSVPMHEQEAKDSTLCQRMDAYLEQQYGEVRPEVGPGLRWLTGRSGYDTCLDHPEYRIKNGLKTITARPYGLYLEQIERLVEIAKDKNLHLHIDSRSNYNLDTVLVVLTQQKP